MDQMSVYAEGYSATQGLLTAGVFEFSQAQPVIESTLGQPGYDEARRALEMLLLTSADFALLPIYLMPQTLALPLIQPMTVPGWAALASVAKGSCSLSRPYHGDGGSFVTFIGDAQKLAESEPGRLVAAPAGDVEPDWNHLADDLREQHRNGGTPLGAAIADSGVLSLQTLVWAAKWATTAPRARVDLQQLSLSLGVTR
jgi:hypothetical protein